MHARLESSFMVTHVAVSPQGLVKVAGRTTYMSVLRLFLYLYYNIHYQNFLIYTLWYHAKNLLGFISSQLNVTRHHDFRLVVPSIKSTPLHIFFMRYISCYRDL